MLFYPSDSDNRRYKITQKYKAAYKQLDSMFIL